MAGLVDFHRVDRRLAVLGADDEQRTLIEAMLLTGPGSCWQGSRPSGRGRRRELRSACPNRQGSRRPYRRADGSGRPPGAVAANQLLADAYRLEVHAEDRWDLCWLAGRRKPLIWLSTALTFSWSLATVQSMLTVASNSTHIGDLRGIEIVDAFARRAVHEIVGRMLVRPRGAAAIFLDDFEDRVGLQGIVRIERCALAPIRSGSEGVSPGR